MGMATFSPSQVVSLLKNDMDPDVGGGGIGRIMDYLDRSRTHASWDEAIRILKTTFPDLPAPDLPAYDEDDWREIAKNTFVAGEDGRLHRD